MSWLPARITFKLREQRPGARACEYRQQATEMIRAAILASLDGAATAGAASDAERLWYLRVDLMTVLASALGEAAARGRLREINALFQELLPGSFVCRPGGAGATPAGLDSR